MQRSMRMQGRIEVLMQRDSVLPIAGAVIFRLQDLLSDKNHAESHMLRKPALTSALNNPVLGMARGNPTASE